LPDFCRWARWVASWRALLICVGLELAISDTSYMVSGYVPTYLKKTVGLPDNPALVMVLVVLAVLTIGVLLVGLPMLFLSSLEPAILPALFPTNVRYGAVSTGFNIAVSAFGGTTPLIAESLVAGTGNAMMPACMLMFAGLVGAITLIFAPEVAGKPLLGSGPSIDGQEEAGDLVGTQRAE